MVIFLQFHNLIGKSCAQIPNFLKVFLGRGGVIQVIDLLDLNNGEQGELSGNTNGVMCYFFRSVENKYPSRGCMHLVLTTAVN